MSELNETQIAEFKTMLSAELEELRALGRSSSADRAPVELDQQGVGRLSRMDAMQLQAMALAAERRRADRINIVESALGRIAAQEYGYCLSCDEPIAIRRLNADPAAARCLSCAGSDERLKR